MMIIAGGVLTLTLGPPLLGVLALATAAAVALGGALIPLVFLGMALASSFESLKDVAGSTAGQLAFVFDTFKEVWSQTAQPGVEVLMKSLIQVLQILMPLVQAMKEPLTVLATAAGQAMEAAATGLAALGPELTPDAGRRRAAGRPHG